MVAKLDFNQIKLENERSGHVTKRLNRLSTWKFFQVLYRGGMFRMMLMNILLLVTVVPAVIFYLRYNSGISTLAAVLPSSNALGIGSAAWLDVAAYSKTQVFALENNMRLWWIPCIALISVAYSGGMAIIRDSFWTGKLVIFKPLGKGIAESIAYTFPGFTILSAMFYGIYRLNIFLPTVMASWLSVVLVVIAWVVMAFVGLYMLILFGVVATYKQSFAQNLKDAWVLLCMNIIPNIFKLIITVAPVVLMLLSLNSVIGSLILAVFLMFGMFYLVFVFQVHMMKTFALFHPIQEKKKA